MTSGGSGMRALSPIISDESLSYSLKHVSKGGGGGGTHFTFHGGALISSSIFPVFMMTSSNENMFRVTGFCAGNSPVTAGN